MRKFAKLTTAICKMFQLDSFFSCEVLTSYLAICKSIKSMEGWCTHFLYRILDSKKTSHFQFSVPGLREIHRSQKQQKNFNSRDGFFRKSPFCTFSCIYSGIGRPWVMLRKKILIAIFIMLQKNTFGQQKFWISCTGSKVPIWQFFNFAKIF